MVNPETGRKVNLVEELVREFCHNMVASRGEPAGMLAGRAHRRCRTQGVV